MLSYIITPKTKLIAHPHRIEAAYLSCVLLLQVRSGPSYYYTGLKTPRKSVAKQK